MPQNADNSPVQAQLEQLDAALNSGAFVQVRRMLNGLPAADIARLLESSPPKQRELLWQLVDSDKEGDVLHAIGDDVSAQLMRDMDTDKVVRIAEQLEPDDVADLLQQLPEAVIAKVLQAMNTQDRQRVEPVLTYREDTAGGLMNTDTITVRPSHTLDVVLRYLRRHEKIPRMTDTLIVVNRRDTFLGLLPLRKILVSDPTITVREVMLTEVEPIQADLPASEVASLFERHDWVSAPVVDADSKLLGRITIDDVVDVIIDDADHSLMSMAGLDEAEDTFAPVLQAAPRRAIWLGLNLITAFIAAAAINLFRETLDQVVALAILMPIVASMGGVAGSQTLTIVVRGIALGHIGRNNTRWLFNRELILAALNGMLWAALVAIVAVFWFEDIRIGLVIALAMFINLLTAAIAGVVLPLMLKAMKIDPALAGTVALTTVTDVVGFVSFLGLA
ncbi:MAG: magnesium transporter, partial [Pseudomonadales bacterium]